MAATQQRRWFTATRLLNALLWVPALAIAQSAPDAASRPEHTGAWPEAIIHERMSAYARDFPEIEFLHLRGGESWLQDFVQLRQHLGESATNAVYDHPPEMAETLMELSLQRSQRMLRGGRASSDFFRIEGDGARGYQYLCVITLNPDSAAGSDLQATRNLLAVPEDALQGMPEERRLEHRTHLEFILDHEIFHCLDPYIYGPIPMSTLEHWGEYVFYRNENAADAFAVAQHLVRHGSFSDYARNLMQIRALALLSNDPNHCTCESIREVRKVSAKSLATMDIRTRIALADRIRQEVTKTYEGYLEFRGAAGEARKRMGVDASADAKFAPHAPDDANLIETLVARSVACYHDLFGTPYPLEATTVESECGAITE